MSVHSATVRQQTAWQIPPAERDHFDHNCRQQDQRPSELVAALTLQIARGRPHEVLDMIECLLAGAIERDDKQTARELRILRDVAIVEQQRRHEPSTDVPQSDSANMVMLMIEFADQILPVVRRVAAVGSNPVLAHQLTETFFPRASQMETATEPAGMLSPRERQVLLLVSAGYANRDIAASLCISEGTVKKHISNVLAKLGATNRTQAVAIARGLGVLETTGSTTSRFLRTHDSGAEHS